jgi:hypothetical protein
VRSKLKQHRVLLPTLFARGTEVSNLINEISSISGKPSDYLEIGVEYGTTFQAVKAKRKVGVDPLFRFHRGFQWHRVNLYEKTSNDFFLVNDIEHFDIVFLDGLHTAEQTYTDFINSMLIVDEKSIIIIDDTFPSDAHSALSTPEVTYKSRMDAGIMNNFEWHGDTYGCVFALIEKYPMLKHITISDMENPVTIFYGFNKNIVPTKMDRYVPKISYGSFLASKVIQIPDEFNPVTKKIFLQRLRTYYESL